MKTRRFLFVMALIGITLACKFPGYIPSFKNLIKVESVVVNPSSGTGSFTLEVTYTALYKDYIEPITCYYVTPDGATLPIGSVVPPSGSPGGTTLTGTLTLSMSDPDPGVYTATCENNSSTSKASAVFGVTDPPDQGQNEPPPPPANPPPANPPPEQPAGPITVTGTGRNIFSVTPVRVSDTYINCTVPADFSLTVEADGKAQLSVTTTGHNSLITESNYGDGYIYTCGFNSYTGTAIYNGYVNAAEGEKIVSIDTSERGCVGKFSYADGVLSGGMICPYMGTTVNNFLIP